MPRFEIHTLAQPASVLRLPGTDAAARAYNPSLAWHGGNLAVAFRISTMTRCRERQVEFARYYSGELPPIVNGVGVAFLAPSNMTMRDARQLNIAMPRDC